MSWANIKPYPSNYERAVDFVDKLGLQIELGGGDFEVCYLQGKVSYQTSKLPSKIRKGGGLSPKVD